MLNKKLLNSILARYNIEITDYSNYFIAMTHSTYANEHNCQSNERIEFLGDAVLGMLTAEYIYKNFPDMPEGKMTKLRATYVCEDANLSYAKEMQLDKLIMLGKGEEATGGRQKVAVIADTFECFLGATYLTCGIEAVKNILKVVVFPHIKAIDHVQFFDFKTKLQEYVQAEKDSSLVYKTLKEEGPSHDKKFTQAVFLDGIKLGVGVGKSKKEAEQRAAEAALKKMVK